MPQPGFWSRLREARLARVLLVYLAASWLILQVVALLQDRLQLPEWLTPVSIALLLIGLLVVASTAWVQSHPATKAKAEELPRPWQIDLKGLVKSLGQRRLPHLTWARAILGGVVAFSLLFGGSGIYLYLKGRGAGLSLVKEATAAAGPGVAVLPFRVVGPGLELWREGMVDLLSTNLDGVAGMRAVDPRAVLSKWREEIGEGKEASAREAALQVARNAGATYALMGSAVALGGGVRLSAEVYDVGTGKQVGTGLVEGATDSVFPLVNRLTIQVLQSGLVREPAGLPTVDLSRLTTSSLPALKAYLAGEQKYRRNRFTEAAEDFTRALEADSAFALALYRLSTAYGWVEGGSPRVGEYSEQAARFADRLPEREALLLRANQEFHRGRVSAIDTLERLTWRYPDYVEGWYQLGDVQRHLGRDALQPDEKFRAAFRRALALDPTLGPAYIHLIEDALTRHDSAEARDLIARYKQLDPASPHARAFELANALVWGDSGSRAPADAALDTLSIDVLGRLSASFAFSRPDFGELWVRIARAFMDERRSLDDRTRGGWQVQFAYFSQGRLAEARQALASIPGEDASSAGVASTLLYWHLYGDGYEDSLGASRAASVLASNPEWWARIWAGAMAANEKRWADAEKEIQALEASARESQQKGDTVAVAHRKAWAQALRGFVALRRGQLQVAVREFEGVFQASGVDRYRLRYELGKLWLELGDLRKAERYFRSVDRGAIGAPAQFYLGQIYEALGEVEQAKLHYARFVSWWEKCDPSLRPWWERGRQALARLTRETASR